MTENELKKLIRDIVDQAKSLKDKWDIEKDAPVNYACIFCQSEKGFNDLIELAKDFGQIIQETPSGPLFKIFPLDTSAGKLQLLKIRKYDSEHPDRGDADFSLSNYDQFKSERLSDPKFRLITKDNFEMIELMDPKFNVRAYFSNPPLDQQLGLK